MMKVVISLKEYFWVPRLTNYDSQDNSLKIITITKYQIPLTAIFFAQFVISHNSTYILFSPVTPKWPSSRQRKPYSIQSMSAKLRTHPSHQPDFKHHIFNYHSEHQRPQNTRKHNICVHHKHHKHNLHSWFLQTNMGMPKSCRAASTTTARQCVLCVCATSCYSHFIYK